MNPRIIEQLGGKKNFQRDVRNDSELLEAVQNGIPSSAADFWMKENQLTAVTISQFLGMNARTLERRKGKNLNPNEGDALIQLVDLFAYGKEVIGNNDHFFKWIYAENAALGHKKPIDLLSTSIGRDSVKNILGRIDFGIYS